MQKIIGNAKFNLQIKGTLSSTFSLRENPTIYDNITPAFTLFE